MSDLSDIPLIMLLSLFLLQIIGLCLVGLSIYLLASQNDLAFLTGNRIASGGVLILIAGIITAVISLIGVVGAIGMWPVLLIVVRVASVSMGTILGGWCVSMGTLLYPTILGGMYPWEPCYIHGNHPRWVVRIHGNPAVSNYPRWYVSMGTLLYPWEPS